MIVMNDEQLLHSDIKYFKKKLGTIMNSISTLKKELKRTKNDKTEKALEERYKIMNHLDNLNSTLARYQRLMSYLQSYLEMKFPKEKE